MRYTSLGSVAVGVVRLNQYMIEIHAPGFRDLQVSHVVCDYNGTLTVDGEILLGVHNSLTSPALDVDIYMLSWPRYEIWTITALSAT